MKIKILALWGMGSRALGEELGHGTPGQNQTGFGSRAAVRHKEFEGFAGYEAGCELPA